VRSSQPGTAPGRRARTPSRKGRMTRRIPDGPSPAGIGRDLHSGGCGGERREEEAPRVPPPLNEDFEGVLKTPENLVGSEAVDSAAAVTVI